MKYSWKQRRWRADGAIEGKARYAEGILEACAHAMQAIECLRSPRGREKVGFHMSSLAAKDAWRGSGGSYVMLGCSGQPFPSLKVAIVAPLFLNAARLIGTLSHWTMLRHFNLPRGLSDFLALVQKISKNSWCSFDKFIHCAEMTW